VLVRRNKSVYFCRYHNAVCFRRDWQHVLRGRRRRGQQRWASCCPGTSAGSCCSCILSGHQWRCGRRSRSSRLTTAKAVQDALDHLPSAHASVQRCHWYQARDRGTRTAMFVMPEARALGRRVSARLRKGRHGPARMGQERGQGACRMEWGLGGRQTSSSERRGRASAAGREDPPCSDPAGPDRTVIETATGSHRADLSHRVASQPGRACVAARLALTVQSGERGRSGLP
jgi:hypothetical protein